jgi:hypothetical protein
MDTDMDGLTSQGRRWQGRVGMGGEEMGMGTGVGGQHHPVPSLVAISYLCYQSFDVVILTMILRLSGSEIALRDNESERMGKELGRLG